MTEDNFPYHLANLERGWDSYDGNPPDGDSVWRAWYLAEFIRNEFTSPPTYVPCSDGSVQVEWHCDGWDVEMSVSRYRANDG